MKVFFFSILLSVPFGAYAAPKLKQPEANIEKRPALPGADAPLVLTPDRPNFCIMGAQSGKALHSEAAFKSIVWKNDVVYVGETSGDPLDHMAQFEALKAMRTARGSKIAVGFELLDQTLQPVLDGYAAGRLTEDEFLAKAGRQNDRGFDFNMYKPLFDFIVANKLRALGLNVPKKTAEKIAGSGLESLTPEEKQYLPEPVNITRHKKYNDYLKTSFSGPGDPATAQIFTLDNYLASMAASNESMGNRVAVFLNENPGFAVLVIAGNSRLLYNAAIPASVKARAKGVRQASFYTENAVKCPELLPREHKDLANYIWYMNHLPKPKPAAPPEEPAMPALSAITLPSADPGK